MKNGKFNTRKNSFTFRKYFSSTYSDMKSVFSLLALAMLFYSCSEQKTNHTLPITGTWQLLSGTLVEKGDTTITLYGDKAKMIKIINDTHFSFLNHDLNHGKDSTASFVAGGGRYTLNGDQYTEFLEYCNDRNWEGHEFQFTVSIKNDTLIQTGVEKIENLGVERLNMEKYVRVKE